MNKRKICVVVTARPSYSRIKTALTAIKENPNLELQLIVAASALLDRYGNAVNYIERDGFTVNARVYNVLEGENLTSMAKTTGLGILELSTIFDNLMPDFVLTVADRYETIATAIAAAYMNIPLVHIQGGEVTGNIDEKVRHAITKLSDYHFVASKDAYNRVIKMGEEPDSVFITGCPSIDLAKEVLDNNTLDFNPFEKYGGVGELDSLQNGYIVVLQHPVTEEYELAKQQINETLKAIHNLKIPTLWFWPNVDAGSDGTSKGIRVFREKYDIPFIHFFKNMEGKDFLKIIYNSKCLIGNSSVGIRESSFLGVPVVNIGSRQAGRERGKNVMDVNYSVGEIESAIKKQIEVKHYPSETIYGNGESGKNISDLLVTVKPKFSKKISY